MLDNQPSMGTEVESALNSYWTNEANIAALAKVSGCGIDEIVDNPNSVSSETVSDLRQLLLRKKHLLSVLRVFQKKALAASSVVDLSKYRSLVSSRPYQAY